jgi:quercetin dioxygenase-like cupin family protein
MCRKEPSVSNYDPACSNGPGWFPIVPGIRRKTIAAGQAMMQMLVHLDSGSHLPAHSHPHEQVTHIVSGRLRMLLDGRPHELGPGDTLLIPGGVTHEADTLEQAVAIDTFSPPREDLLAQDHSTL